MSEALVTLAVLACPIGMGAMMFMMMRGKGKPPEGDKNPDAVSDAELTRLRAEVDQLRAAHAEAQRREGDRQ
ncbi:MAG: hypothetical protein GEV07_14525 [Streptosporangiales bacterium]|nr:hypothetical protein [Streptosporangiales bacterium]